jgi:hypothetical protein
VALKKTTIADLLKVAEAHLYDAEFATEYYYWSGRVSVLKEVYNMIEFDLDYDENRLQ